MIYSATKIRKHLAVISYEGWDKEHCQIFAEYSTVFSELYTKSNYDHMYMSSLPPPHINLKCFLILIALYLLQMSKNTSQPILKTICS